MDVIILTDLVCVLLGIASLLHLSTLFNCCFILEAIIVAKFLLYFVFVGYVLDCIPSASEIWKSYSDQLHFLWDLEMKPDYIINLKVC